jgi:hypothetical protein
MFSKAILGTQTNKVKMSWWDYWVLHCWMTGWQSIRNNFITWMDLVWFEDNQKHYILLKGDIPFEQCYIEFWFGLNDDDVYPKEFLESLMQMADDVETGKVETVELFLPLKVETVPFTKEMFDKLNDLVGDMIDE